MGRTPGPPGSATDRNPRVAAFRHAEGVGWRHGDIPDPPARVTKAAREAWATWFAAWWAWFYELEDLPGLRLLCVAYSRSMGAEGNKWLAQYRGLAATYGITEAGRLANRWAPMVETADAGSSSSSGDAEVDDQLAAAREARARRLA